MLSSMATARQGPGVGVLGGLLYAVGGYVLSSMEVYDPSTNAWRTGPSMATARSGPGVGVLDNVLYAVGGQGSSNVLSSMEAYAPLSSSAWNDRT